ncbi:FkbM family methyltransferase [Pseudomonadota bacterium]
MNWRYFVGKYLDEATQGMCRLGMPGTRYIRGRYWAFDIKKLYSHGAIPVQRIVDAGANIGQTALYVNRWFRGADVYCFEPVKESYLALIENTKQHSNIHAINSALSSARGHRDIRLYANSELATFHLNETDLSVGLKSVGTEKVTCDTLDDCFPDGYPIDILKMDVQGHEIEVLEGARDHLEDGRIHFIIGEAGFRSENRDCNFFPTFHNYVYSRGFLLCGFYDQYRHWEEKLLISFCNALYVNTSFYIKKV